MDVFVARQPIYDASLKVFAYELLYRSNARVNMYDVGNNPDAATISVIIESFLSIGIETLTNKTLGFINFTENILKSRFIKLLPSQNLGIEILETVNPTEEVLKACGDLKNTGYTLVLDDYSYKCETCKFIPYADMIKMDFMSSDDTQLKSIVKKYKKDGLKFVAEKIETEEDYLKALSYGYDYFQGYYFSKPHIVQGKDLLPFQVSTLKVFELLQNEECDIEDIASIIGDDPAMAYKLLRLANSVMYGGRGRITNLSSAVVRIGLKELRVWIIYIMMYGTNKNKPDELIKQSILRAWEAGEICRAKNLSKDIAGFSLMGLLSLMDVIMDASFETILSNTNISENIAGALINPGDDSYGAALRLIGAYDAADWEGAETAGKLIGLSLEEYQGIYLRAIKECDGIYNNLLAS